MLHFICRGEHYKVNGDGDITQNKNNDFSKQWQFLGVTFHHWRTYLDIHYHQDIAPKDLIGGLVWDIDHGTTRKWAGRYHGRLPRITEAWAS